MNEPKTNKLEDSKLWQACVKLAEKIHNDLGEFTDENKNWSLMFKLRQRAFDLTASIADAEGSNAPRDIEWYYDQARTALFGIKNAYHMARKLAVFKVAPEDMVHIDKLIKDVEFEIVRAHKAVHELEIEEVKRRLR